jgi:hypothetical protein
MTTMNEAIQQALAEAADRVTAEVQAGRMSAAEGQAFMRDLNAEATKIVLNPTPTPATSTDPRVAPPVQKDELELYADSLRREGAPESEILKKLFAADPAERTAAAKVELETQQKHLNERAAAKHDASPAGLREAAEAERTAQAVRASMLADADTLLQSRGLTEGDLRQLTENERIRFSGIDPTATDAVQRESGSSMLAEGSDVTATHAAREIAAQTAEGSEGQ